MHSLLGNPLNNFVCLFRLYQNLISFPSGVVQSCLIYTALSQPWIFTRRTDAEARILWPPDVNRWFIRKDLDARKDWGQEKKLVTEDEMVGWHHGANGHQSDQNPGDSEGQGSLVCCSPWGHRVGHHLAAEQQSQLIWEEPSFENSQWARSEQSGLNWVLSGFCVRSATNTFSWVSFLVFVDLLQ